MFIVASAIYFSMVVLICTEFVFICIIIVLRETGIDS